jgi:hypothetical protein
VECVPEDHDVTRESCDLCGAALDEDRRLFLVVSDSSYLSTVDSALDGQRVISACGAEHLAELERRYRARPFHVEELWAARLVRFTLASAADAPDPSGARAPRLTTSQIRAALRWLVEHGLPP